MVETAAYLLRVRDPRRAAELAEYADFESEFSESVPSFAVSGRDRLLGLLSLVPGHLSHLARAKRGRVSATGRRRLNLLRTVPIEPVAIEDVAAALPKDMRRSLRPILEDGGLIVSKRWALVEEALASVSPQAAAAIDLLIPYRERLVDSMGPAEREVIALEHEAVAIALRMAGFDQAEREVALAWNPSRARSLASFLDGLDAVPLREDTMIMNDLQVVPGFERLAQTKFGAVRFENEDTSLILLHANHQRLEETLGVDLIYYNQTFESFVCVQYKAMEQESSGAVFRFPTEDLTRELARMDLAISRLAAAARSPHPHGFRLSENPFI